MSDVPPTSKVIHDTIVGNVRIKISVPRQGITVVDGAGVTNNTVEPPTVGESLTHITQLGDLSITVMIPPKATGSRGGHSCGGSSSDGADDNSRNAGDTQDNGNNPPAQQPGNDDSVSSLSVYEEGQDDANPTAKECQWEVRGIFQDV